MLCAIAENVQLSLACGSATELRGRDATVADRQEREQLYTWRLEHANIIHVHVGANGSKRMK